MDSRSRDPLPVLIKHHLQCCVQFWAPEYKRDMEILVWVQWRVTRMIKGLEHLSEGEAEGAGSVQP